LRFTVDFFLYDKRPHTDIPAASKEQRGMQASASCKVSYAAAVP